METKDLLKKVRKIEIKTRRLSDHIFSGEYHTSFKGRGMTFSEVRQYQFGDDIRAIDWNVTARYNEPYVNYYLRYPAYRDYPVVGVSWLQATEFCKWRSDRVNEYIMIREGLMKNSNINKQNDETFNTEAYMLGLTPIDIKKQLKDYTPGGKKRDVKMEDGILLPIYRLPTEAEWEFSARGGKSSKGYTYSGSNDLNSVAWNTDNSGSKTHTVGGKQANELGIYDMSGNVWEWCSDWYGTYNSYSETNPTGASLGQYRVLRGGSWNNNANNCRTANRNRNNPDNRNNNNGFRLVLPAAH
jgi:formylglycine-generating enzyme required for sulfatase activity